MANVTESSNTKIINYNNNPLPKIQVPFPPEINAKDLIVHRESPDGTKKLTTRAPNAFIIFRKQFVKTARDEGHFLPMTVISSMASAAWENEKEEVRVEYKRIAREAHIQRKAMCPKSNNRRKRKEKWNLVSFVPSTSVNKPGSKMISNKSTTNIITAGNGNNNITNTNNNHNIINDHIITNDLSPVKSESILTPEINENYFDQYYPNFSYTSYNENSDLSYNSYNDLSYTPYSDDNNHSTSPNKNININSNLNLNMNSNTNTNTDSNTDLYGNTEQYPSPYLMGIPTINIPDNNNDNNNENNNNLLHDYNSILENNNIQQNDLYNDDDKLKIYPFQLSASPSNSLSDFTSNASSSPSIASPSIISLDAPTSALAGSDLTDFTDFTDFTILNNTTQNNYAIMDFPSIIYNNDTIMQPLIMMQ